MCCWTLLVAHQSGPIRTDVQICQPLGFLGSFEALEHFGFSQGSQCGTQLPFCEIGAKTEVSSMPESQVIVWVAADVKVGAPTCR